MRRILLLLLLLNTTCFGQTILEGTLISIPNTSFSVITGQSALNEYAGVNIGSGKTGDSGLFNVPIHLAAEQPVTLFIGNTFFTLWAKPGTRLTVRESAGGRYSFSGAMAKENTVLSRSGLMQPYKIPGDIGLSTFEPQQQLSYLDSIENNRMLLLQEAEKNGPVSKKFASYYKTETAAFGFFNKNQYPALSKVKNKDIEKYIPGDYFIFWNKFKLEDDSTASNLYQYALQGFIEFKTLERIGKSQMGSEKAWYEMFRTADTLLAQYPLSLQKQKTGYLLLLIKYFNYPAATANEIDGYKKQFPSSASIAIIDNLWKKKHGMTLSTPSFRLKNSEGNWVDIKDFRGKVIYVDFWGSWCTACLVNMPHAELLKQKFRGKDVVFIYLDFYDTREKWLTAIKKHNINGTHLKAEKSDEAYFNSVFNINQGFPRYALINKEGKLITMSAPQPQDPSAYDLIKKHLDE